MSLRLPHPTLYSLEDALANFEELARLLEVPRVTALPATPFDGQTIDYVADDANGVVWRFRYRAGSASAFKWEFVGGSSVGTGQAGDMTNTNNRDTALTGGPTITAPLSGDYGIRMKLTFVISAASIATATAYINGVATAASVASNVGQVTNITEGRVQGVTAGQVFDVRCSNANSVSTRYVNAALFIAPIRVG